MTTSTFGIRPLTAGEIDFVTGGTTNLGKVLAGGIEAMVKNFPTISSAAGSLDALPLTPIKFPTSGLGYLSSLL